MIEKNFRKRVGCEERKFISLRHRVVEMLSKWLKEIKKGGYQIIKIEIRKVKWAHGFFPPVYEGIDISVKAVKIS